MIAPDVPRAVVKFGGQVVLQRAALAALMTDIAELVARGWKVVICHGGGPQATALSERLGLRAHKVGGRRITDEATLQVMKQTLAGEVSVDVCAAAAAAGLPAVGISGTSAGLVTARRRPPKLVSGAGPEPIDFGLVGDVVEIRHRVLDHLLAGGYVPVVSSLGIAATAPPGETCEVYNINADTVAAAIAAALAAHHLFLVTDVPGVLRERHDPSSRIPVLTAAMARAAIADGTIVGGMIPKVEEALANLERGIKQVHILGAAPGGLERAATDPGGFGTVLVAAADV